MYNLSSDTSYILPPTGCSAEHVAHAEAWAAKLYHAVGCRGAARVDFIVDPERGPQLLEINTLPGMTSTSLVPKIAQSRGVDFPMLQAWILDCATRDSLREL